MEFVPKDLIIKLQEKGLNKKTYFVYNDEQVINPDVVEKYGELSDDGYYELTKQGGGKLKWNYVYIYQTEIMPKRYVIVERNCVNAYTIEEVLDWVRDEKKIHVMFDLCPSGYNPIFLTEIYKDDDGYFNNNFIDNCNCYPTYKDAAIAAIKYIINKKLI